MSKESESEPRRWGKRVIRQVGPHEWEDRSSPEGLTKWNADVAALLASRHTETRSVEHYRYGPLNTEDVRPAVLPGENLEHELYAGYFIHRVDDPPGRRLIRWADREHSGRCIVWEMPGFTAQDAYVLAHAFVDGYTVGWEGDLPPLVTPE